MLSNRLKMFGKLYTKDLHEVTMEILIVVIGVVLVTAGFLLNSDTPSPVYIFPLLLLLGLAGFLPLLSSFKLLYREWSQNTVYLIMSLPVSGAMMLGAKLAVLMTQYIIGTAMITLSAYLLYTTNLYQYFNAFLPQLGNYDLVHNLLNVYVAGLVFLLFLCCNSFFSQVTGRLSRRFSGLITAATFIVTLIVSDGILDMIKNSNLTGDIKTAQIFGAAASFSANSVMSSSSLGYLLLAVVLFVLAAVIYDRKLEL